MNEPPSSPGDLPGLEATHHSAFLISRHTTSGRFPVLAFGSIRGSNTIPLPTARPRWFGTTWGHATTNRRQDSGCIQMETPTMQSSLSPWIGAIASWTRELTGCLR